MTKNFLTSSLSYLFRLGVLDGYQGFLIASMAARYVRRKHSKWESMTQEAIRQEKVKEQNSRVRTPGTGIGGGSAKS